MRPGSSSGNAPPGTGSIRPGSGARRPPGTSRLRTGMAGPGTEAAQGVSIQAAINVSDRPLTGQGVLGMRTQSQSGGRLVLDASHFIGVLRKRITDITTETNRLQQEVEQISKDNTQYSQLEKKYESLIKSKDSLEGQLADYNLAMDKSRTSTDPDELFQLANHLNDKNRQGSQELDRVFMVRKQREQEVAQVEDKLEAHYQSIQARINELEPGKLRAYNELMSKQREYQERCSTAEAKINDLNARIRQFDGDDKGNALRKEYMTLDKAIQGKRREIAILEEELDIAGLDPKEAHSRFVARVNDIKQNTKSLEDRIFQSREELDRARKQLAELSSSSVADTSEEGDAAKYELLQKRDQEMTAFMDTFDEKRNGVLTDMENTKALIVALLEHISSGLEDQSNMPSQQTNEELQETNSFKKKNLESAQKTMESLSAELKKRQKELDQLKNSEVKFTQELSSLKSTISRMKDEIQEFVNIEGLRRGYESTQAMLQDLKRGYVKRRDAMKSQVQTVSNENENIKRALNNNEVVKELDDTEKRLRHNERTIFELKEFIDAKAMETNYEITKANCLKNVELLNQLSIRKAQEVTGGFARK